MKLKEHRLVAALCGIAFAVVLGGFIGSLAALRGAYGGPLVLHFSDLGGITDIAGIQPINFIGAFGLLVVLMNFFIAVELDRRDSFLGKFLAAFTAAFGILLFIAFAAILNANV